MLWMILRLEPPNGIIDIGLKPEQEKYVRHLRNNRYGQTIYTFGDKFNCNYCRHKT